MSSTDNPQLGGGYMIAPLTIIIRKLQLLKEVEVSLDKILSWCALPTVFIPKH